MLVLYGHYPNRLSPLPPLCQMGKRGKKCPKPSWQALATPPPLRAMSIWKQHISIRGFPKLGEAIRANRNSAFASILEALQVDYLKYLFI